ncbi:DUF885 family protein [Kitasatospora sp. NPDC017646]|uniref:DUF885 family protein n=1 Tax=Kitasatospora sp. NPDC017646 TaxID=3364024 RepID=UPI0037A7956A
MTAGRRTRAAPVDRLRRPAQHLPDHPGELAVPADPGFHPGERWTPALVLDFMAAHHGSELPRRTSEIDRHLGTPGRAIGYKLGERAWLQGREAALRRQGPAFDLRTWHTAVLAQGSLGLDDPAARLAEA